MASETSAHPSVLVFGFSEAAMFLRNHSNEVSGLISICGRSEPTLDADCKGEALELKFDDAEALDMTDPDSALQAWARQRYGTASNAASYRRCYCDH